MLRKTVVLFLLAAACGGPAATPDAAPATSLSKNALPFHGGALTVAGTLANGAPQAGIAGAAGSYTWFHVDLPAGATNLTIALGSGTDANNDADLYARAGDPSTISFDCSSWNYGLTDSCTVNAPAAGGWSILVYGYTNFTGATLTASWKTAAAAPVSVHLQLGVPDASSATSTTHYLSLKPQFAMSYDSSHKIPNWVSWELNAASLGPAARTTSFHQDSTLPAGMPQASNTDYSYSGFDRGHLCPSADRTDTDDDNYATFVLTNVVPQAADSNRGPWEKLEAYERSLASAGKELTIIAGGLYGPFPRTIGKGVAVPDAMFKVIVVADAPGAWSVTSSTRVIAVVIPNDDGQVAQTDDWKQFRTSARAIETQSGLDFMSDVPRSIQDAIETQVDSL